MTELGLHFMRGRPLAEEATRLERMAHLVTDPRWCISFKLVDIGHVPGKPLEPVFSGRIAARELPDAARMALCGENVDHVMFGTSRKESSDVARFYINTGRTNGEPSWGNTRWRVPYEPAAAAWVTLQHEIVVATGAQHAVIVATTTSELAGIEVWMQNVSHEGKPVHPHPQEISSYMVHRHELGDTYVRAPRWGTYLSPKHLAAIGGRAAVAATVEPAVVREVGPLVYFQLTERVSDAFAPATEAKRARFEQLARPLLPPRA
jgi:hypothetical protein